ncbi:MAG: hypothetical protein KW802_02605 [Candidatus Doudnabacteria bacterium]|nr:hypothetical protein [Candidatus Doudnabacteria bacterium]
MNAQVLQVPASPKALVVGLDIGVTTGPARILTITQLLDYTYRALESATEAMICNRLTAREQVLVREAILESPRSVPIRILSREDIIRELRKLGYDPDPTPVINDNVVVPFPRNTKSDRGTADRKLPKNRPRSPALVLAAEYEKVSEATALLAKQLRTENLPTKELRLLRDSVRWALKDLGLR